jgi:hypothetical protein
MESPEGNIEQDPEFTRASAGTRAPRLGKRQWYSSVVFLHFRPPQRLMAQLSMSSEAFESCPESMA